MRDETIHLHTSLATKIEKIQIEVDRLLSQFFTGQAPWCPILQLHRDRIDYWH